MRVLFFTDGPESPGSRFRCLQFFPHLALHGIQCEARFAYDARYNDVFDKAWAPAYKLQSRLRRVAHLILDTDYDVIFLHKTALAFTGLPEQLRRLRATPMVFDFDDAIYLAAGGVRSLLRARAFGRAVKVADRVIAGNAYLADSTRAPDKTVVIPSVIDTDRYVPRVRPPGRDLVVGWMGTASNFPNLEPVLPAVLRAVERLPAARLRIVSNGVMRKYEGHPRVEHWRWQEARELMALHSFDLGLMPLEDNEQTRGKCGFKMIQYMATGVPVVASAVGANVDIFRHSDAGTLVAPDGDWEAAVMDLARAPERRAACALAGRQHAVAHYSIHAVLPRYVELFRALTRT